MADPGTKPSIKEIQEDIVDEFAMFDDWTDKYQHLIELGKNLSPLAEEHYIDDNLIKGCQSRVWLHPYLDENNNVIYEADSDAVITKGLISLMIRVLSGHSPDEIINADMQFIDDIGMKQHLSPTRANGLVSMIKQMKAYALGFKAKTEGTDSA